MMNYYINKELLKSYIFVYVLVKILSRPGHGNSKRYTVDNWTCFSSSNAFLIQHYVSPTYNAVLRSLPRQLNTQVILMTLKLRVSHVTLSTV